MYIYAYVYVCVYVCICIRQAVAVACQSVTRPQKPGGCFRTIHRAPYGARIYTQSPY